MVFELFTKLHSVLHNKINLANAACRVQSKNFFVENKKGKSKKPDVCPNKTCNEHKKEKKPKKSRWNIFGSGKEEEEKEATPSKESCRRLIAKQGCQPDPDLSEFGGMAYRTAGSAFVVQTDLVEVPPEKQEPEEKLLEKLEKHPDLKDVEDPMPEFQSVEQRMIKLSELGLHPMYKRYMSVPTIKIDLSLPQHVYQTRSGPISDDEYPAHLKVNKACLDKKNIFAEFKRAEPPRQLVAKMLEIRKNERPTLERKSVKCPLHPVEVVYEDTKKDKGKCAK